MSAKLRFRMPEGVDIGARARLDAHTRSATVDPRRRSPPQKTPRHFYSSVRVWEARENVFSGLFFFIRGALEAPSPEPTTDDTLPSPSRFDATLDDAFATRVLEQNVTSSKKGPIDVPLSDKMFAVKERALAAWPEPGPAFSKPVPPGPHAVKIILNGRVLDNGKTLRDVHVASDAMVTCHLMVQVKHPPPSRSMVRAAGKTSDSAPGCGCVVS